jgi:diadenosine tetraphosphate (Ap4A) HIT family hydrolase
MDQYNTTFQTEQRRRLRESLDRIHARSGLGAALEGLRLNQVETGFIQDDLSEVMRFVFPRAGDNDAFLAAQYNPARARRFRGRGLRTPPLGARSVNDGCFLCGENVEWQHQGAEIGYPVGGTNVPYTAWMNPFPLAMGHAVLAADEHIHQHWAVSGIGLGEIVRDLIDFSDRLPGWITFYNGAGAGASIESHLHFHALPRAPGLAATPIEQAADRHRVDLDPAAALNGAIACGLYPLDFAHWRGRCEDIMAPVLAWLEAWQNQRGGDLDATANAMAVRHADGEKMDVFFVPRVRSRSRAEGLGGVIGAFETMGEIICSHPEEKHLLEGGDVDYEAIADLLRHVSVAL